MLPQDDLCRLPDSAEMSMKRLKRLEHVAVTQVPGGHAPAEHGAVVLLRILDQPRILLGEKQLVLGYASVHARVFASLALQLDQLFEHLPLA